MADEEEYDSRAVSIEFVRDLKRLRGLEFDTEVEDDLRQAIEELLDVEVGEADNEREEAEKDRGKAFGERDEAVSRGESLAWILRMVLDRVGSDPLGSTVNCPSCDRPLEDGSHPSSCPLVALLAYFGEKVEMQK